MRRSFVLARHNRTNIEAARGRGAAVLIRTFLIHLIGRFMKKIKITLSDYNNARKEVLRELKSKWSERLIKSWTTEKVVQKINPNLQVYGGGYGEKPIIMIEKFPPTLKNWMQIVGDALPCENDSNRFTIGDDGKIIVWQRPGNISSYRGAPDWVNPKPLNHINGDLFEVEVI